MPKKKKFLKKQNPKPTEKPKEQLKETHAPTEPVAPVLPQHAPPVAPAQDEINVVLPPERLKCLECSQEFKKSEGRLFKHGFVCKDCLDPVMVPKYCSQGIPYFRCSKHRCEQFLWAAEKCAFIVLAEKALEK